MQSGIRSSRSTTPPSIVCFAGGYLSEAQRDETRADGCVLEARWHIQGTLRGACSVASLMDIATTLPRLGCRRCNRFGQPVSRPQDERLMDLELPGSSTTSEDQPAAPAQRRNTHRLQNAIVKTVHLAIANVSHGVAGVRNCVTSCHEEKEVPQAP